MDSDASFGPWTVVSRKRNDNRGAKLNCMTSLLGIRNGHQHKKLKESLESFSFEQDWVGLSIAKDSNGKRKAHTEVKLSPTLSPSPLEKLLNTFSSGSTATGSGQNSLEGMGRSNKEMSKKKPKANSVKGKKDFACNGVILSSPNTATIPKTSLSIHLC